MPMSRVEGKMFVTTAICNAYGWRMQQRKALSVFYAQTKVVLLKDPDSIIENQENLSKKS
jgi:hypothetical protein